AAAVGGMDRAAGELPHRVRVSVDGDGAVGRIGELDADRALAVTESRLHRVSYRAARGRVSPTATARAPGRRRGPRHWSTRADRAPPRWRPRRARRRPVASS